jgi:ligand-binding sensor domain-containing protein
VNDVQETPDGCLWAATISGVSRRCDQGRWKVQMAQQFPLYANATALALQGTALWVGFATDGLFMFENGIWFRPPASFLPAPTVRTMAVDATNVLWVGTEGGLASYDVKRDWEIESTNSGLVDRNIRTLFFDHETGTMYAGSVGGFVYGRDAGAKSWRILVRQGQLEPGSTTGGKETHK